VEELDRHREVGDPLRFRPGQLPETADESGADPLAPGSQGAAEGITRGGGSKADPRPLFGRFQQPAFEGRAEVSHSRRA